MSDNKELATIELPKELAELKNTATGLSVDKADKILMAFAPHMTRLTELSIEMDKINFDTPTDFDAEMADSLRKKLVKVRTASADEKDLQKEVMKIEDKLIMSSYNLLKSTCELKENRLRDVAEFRKRELERLHALKLEERKALLEPFNAAYDPITLGAWSDEIFANYLAGAKATYEAQKAAEAKAEEDRREQERIKNRHEKRKEQMIPVWNLVGEDVRVMNLGLLSDEDYEHILNVATDRKIADEQAREKERAEAERLRKEREVLEAKLAAEREAAEKKLRDEQEKARKEKEAAELKAKKDREALEEQMKEERRIADQKLAAANAEAARIERERKEKELAEQKKKEAEEKALKIAEAKAAKAPKKQKLNTWIDGFIMGTPIGMNEDETVKEILQKFEGFKQWAKSTIEQL